MPIPFILGAIAAVAGVSGVGAGAYGAKKAYDARETMNNAKYIVERSQNNVKDESKNADTAMDQVGTLELKILESFTTFSNCIEKIQNRPKFSEIQNDNPSLPPLKLDDLREISIGASTMLAGLAGLGLGAAGGVAAAGATTAAVTAFGIASTGTAISTLSGAAATNAVLATLGGGTIAAGGGGVALGTTILGASTLGIGFLVGGAIIAFSGSKLSEQADEAYAEAQKIRKEAAQICKRLSDITSTAKEFYQTLDKIYSIYDNYLNDLSTFVKYRTDWNTYSDKEQEMVEICTLLVGVLYKMCKVPLIKKDCLGEQNANTVEVRDSIHEADMSLAPIPAYEF